MKMFAIIVATALLLQAPASTAHAGPSGTDWAWIGPLIALGAVTALFVTIATMSEPEESEDRRKGRPRRGNLSPALPPGRTLHEYQQPVVWGFRKCSQHGEFALACW